MNQAVKVQNLHLRHGPGIAPQMVQSMVEDALRCQVGAAGLAARAGLVVIRHVDLGRIAERADLPALKHRVASELRRAMDSAWRVDSGDGLEPSVTDDAAVVLFSGPLEPHRRILRALAQGEHVPQSWPFRALFGARLQGPPATLALHVLGEIAEDDSGPAAVADVIVELGATAFSLLAMVPPSVQTRLVQLLTRSGEVERVDRTDAPKEILSALENFGPPSAKIGRVQFEAKKLIIAAHIIRRFNTVPPRALVEALAIQAIEAEDPAIASAEQNTGTSSKSPEPGSVRAAKSALEQPTASVQQSQSSDMPKGLTEPQGMRAEHTDQPSDRVDAPVVAKLAEPLISREVPADKALVPDLKQPVGDEPTGQGAAPADPLPTPPSDKPENAEALPPDDALPSPLRPWVIGEPVLSCHAGAILALNLIHRAYGSWLSEDAHQSAGTGLALLQALQAWAHMSDGDPITQILDALPAPMLPDTAVPCAFHIPFDLLDDEERPETVLCRVSGHPKWRMLRLRDRDMPLALWKGSAPPAVRKLIASMAPERSAASLPFDHAQMHHSCLWALDLLLLKTTARSLRSLCARPGLIVATRTHWDVQFEAGLIDLDLRRIGADLSQGWVPWLMRVVSVHYDFGEESGNA